MKELGYNSQAASPEFIFQIPVPLQKEAAAVGDSWLGPIRKKIGKIAKSAEYAKVAALEGRKAEAEAMLAERTATIDQIKNQCAADVLDNSDVLDSATAEIATCKRAIATARLTLEAVARVLPEAIEARERVTAAGIDAATNDVINAPGEECDRTQRHIREAVHKGYVTLMQAEQRLKRAWEIRRQGVDLVRMCAGAECEHDQE